MLTDGTVWRTTDSGRTLSSLSSSVNYDGVRQAYQSFDGSIIYLTTGATWMWVSRDNGVTFVNQSVPFFVHGLQPHPSVAGRALVMGLTPCCQDSLACTSCNAVLLVTEDGGATFTTLTSYAYYEGTLGYSWIPSDDNVVGRSLVYVRYATQNGDQRLKQGEPMNLYVVTDFQNPNTSIINVVSNGGPMLWYTRSPNTPVLNTTIVMARATIGEPGRDVVISRNAGHNFTAVRYPPLSSFDTLRFWLPTSLGNPFLSVFNGPDYVYGNVYTSVGGTNDFTLSLRGLISQLGQPQWIRLSMNIPGTYLANAFTSIDATTRATYISVNHGGEWHTLNAASSTSITRNSRRQRNTGEILQAMDSSYVQLAAPYPGSTKFHAPASSPGLAIAAGQIGPSLTALSGTTVFVSRDAARTWYNTSLSGSYIVYAVNAGSVLLAALDSEYTTSLSYSLDYGNTWSTCAFASTPVLPISINATTNDDNSMVVLLDTRNTDGTHTIFTLDFTTIYNRTCDYEDIDYWTLQDEVGQECVFGVVNVYTRRLAHAACSLPSGFIHLVSTGTCQCTAADFICPFCFERNSQGECDFLWNDCPNSAAPPAPANCSGSWDDASNPAYVRLPDSSCVGGLTLDNMESVISCPPPPTLILPPPYSTLQGDIFVTICAITLSMATIFIAILYFGCRNYVEGKKRNIEMAVWQAHLRPMSDGDHRREKVKNHLDYQSDMEVPSRTATPSPSKPGVLVNVSSDSLDSYQTLDV